METPQDDFCNHLISLKRKSSESCLDENMLKSISAEQQSTDSISLSNNQKEKDSTQPKKLKKNSPISKKLIHRLTVTPKKYPKKLILITPMFCWICLHLHYSLSRNN